MENNQLEVDLVISDRGRQNLLETAKWGRFIAIATLVLLGLFFIFYLFTALKMKDVYDELNYSRASRNSPDPITTMIITLIICIAIYLYPLIALLRYCNQLKDAAISINNNSIENAFETQKNLYKYLGILLIVFLAIMLLGLLGLIAAS